MSGSKNIVFDVVGTLASYDKFYEVCCFSSRRSLSPYADVDQAVEKVLGDRLRDEGIKPQLFGQLWSEVAGREYVSTSWLTRNLRSDREHLLT